MTVRGSLFRECILRDQSLADFMSRYVVRSTVLSSIHEEIDDCVR